MKEIAPSQKLRKWFTHDPAKFPEFRKRYFAEIETNPALNTLLDLLKKHKKLTLLYAAKDGAINNAAVLKEYIEQAF